MSEYRFTLYVIRNTPSAQKAIADIRGICEEELTGYTLDIVDVQEHVEEAEQKKIWATPTLIKESPPPHRRFVGDFSRKEDVLAGLNINQSEEEPS